MFFHVRFITVVCSLSESRPGRDRFKITIIVFSGSSPSYRFHDIRFRSDGVGKRRHPVAHRVYSCAPANTITSGKRTRRIPIV